MSMISVIKNCSLDTYIHKEICIYELQTRKYILLFHIFLVDVLVNSKTV